MLLHTTTWLNFSAAPIEEDWLLFLRVLLCFATPTFILLSVIILANKYPTALPKGFWVSRFQFLLLPYLAWATIDAMARGLYSSKKTFFDYIWNNIFYGGFVGWFVLIILQLYFFYMIIIKWPWTRLIVLPAGVMIAYIHMNELFLPESFYMEYEGLLRISSTTWLIYFAIAYVLGRYYERIAPLLVKYRYLLLIISFAAGYIVYSAFLAGETAPESRRADLIPFVLAMTLLVLAWGRRLPYFKIVQFLSKYAFAIYLVHWQILFFTTSYVTIWTDSFMLQVILLFTIAISASIGITALLQKVPFGSYIVGKVKQKKVDGTR